MAKAIGSLLRAARERASLTQTAVSKQLGLGAGQLSQIESGRTVSPEFATVARIAAVVGLSLDELASECGYDGRRSGDGSMALRRLTAANERIESILRSLDGAATDARAALSELRVEIADVTPRKGPRKRKRSG